MWTRCATSWPWQPPREDRTRKRSADRLTAPLESAIRLALLEALSEAAEQITRDLAPGSVEVRLRGRDPEFTVSSGIEEGRTCLRAVPSSRPNPRTTAARGGSRCGCRRTCEPGVDAAARGDGLSVNAWLVRAVTAALGGESRRRPRGDSGKHFSGWVR